MFGFGDKRTLARAFSLRPSWRGDHPPRWSERVIPNRQGSFPAGAEHRLRRQDEPAVGFVGPVVLRRGLPGAAFPVDAAVAKLTILAAHRSLSLVHQLEQLVDGVGHEDADQLSSARLGGSKSHDV